MDPIVKITNFSSNSSPEWVEIYNQTDAVIDLTSWSLGDGNTQTVYDLPLTGCLSPSTYQTFFHDDGWLNNSGDTINLYNSQLILVDSLTYSDGKLDLNYRSTNSCTPSATPTPTSSPVPTDTSTPTPTLTSTPTSPPLPTITPSPTVIPSVTNTPTPTKTPTPTHTPAPTATSSPTIIPTNIPTDIPSPSPSLLPLPSGSVLSIADIITPVPTPSPASASSHSTNFLPTIFIIVGSLLLLSPLLINVITRIRNKS